MTPTKDQAKQALQQLHGILRNPAISGFTYDGPLLCQNHMNVIAAYLDASTIQLTGGPSIVQSGDAGAAVSNE